MPSVYDYRHVELDKIGKGKRVLQAPGGNSSNIFGVTKGSNGIIFGVNDSDSVDSPKPVDAGTLSPPSTPLTPVSPSTPINGLSITNGNGVNSSTIIETPTNIANGTNGTAAANGANGVNGANGSTNGHCGAATDTESICSTPSSASSSRRGSRQEDTKNRLFGPELESPRRRVVDRMKSNIFSEQEKGGSAGIVRSASVKRYDYVIRRNPITGEVYDEPNAKLNGCNGNGTVHGNSNGVSNSGSASLPTTPVRIRQPPGGKSSGIF